MYNSLFYVKTFKCIENTLHFYIIMIIKTASAGMVSSMVGDHCPLKMYNVYNAYNTIKIKCGYNLMCNDS